MNNNYLFCKNDNSNQCIDLNKNFNLCIKTENFKCQSLPSTGVCKNGDFSCLDLTSNISMCLTETNECKDLVRQTKICRNDLDNY